MDSISKLGCILFTDIYKSSKLWKKYPKEMGKSILKHEEIIMDIVKVNTGMVVKTIGDSIMVFFEGTKGLENAILSSIIIQTTFKTEPIRIGDTKISIRIGMCTGMLESRIVHIQDCDLEDFFGETVNCASRMESIVSPIGGFAIGLNEDTLLTASIIDSLQNECSSIFVKHYKKSCDKMKSSSRLLTNLITKSECIDYSDLHGVGEKTAVLCEI